MKITERVHKEATWFPAKGLNKGGSQRRKRQRFKRQVLHHWNNACCTCITHAWTMQSMPWPHAELFKVLLQFFMRCEAHGIDANGADANGAGVSKVHRKIMNAESCSLIMWKELETKLESSTFMSCDANGTGLSKVHVQVRIFQSWLVLL